MPIPAFTADSRNRRMTGRALTAFLLSLAGPTVALGAPVILDQPMAEIVLPPLPEDDRSGGLIAHDLNGDGERDFLVTAPGMIVAASLNGGILWQRQVDIQVTLRAERNGLPGHHAPGVQAGDVTGDGRTEVLYLTRDGRLHVVDGATGSLIGERALSAPAGAERWEHAVIGNFRGEGDRDLLLQATNREGYRLGRYVAVFRIADLLDGDVAPTPLWTRDDFPAAAHNGARIADISGDGRDEIIAAGIVDGEGRTLVKAPLQRNSHIDAVQVADVLPDRPGLEVIAAEEGGELRLLPWRNRFSNRVNWNFNRLCCAGDRTFLMNAEGLIWATGYRQREPQNLTVGSFAPESEDVQIWLRSRYNEDQRPYVLDAQGEPITEYELRKTAPPDWPRAGIEVIFPIHWSGSGQQHLAAKARHETGDAAIIDALTGDFIVRIPERTNRLYVADVMGDWREELVILSGHRLRVYGNAAANPNPERGSLWEEQHYRRLKQTWNYYSP